MIDERAIINPSAKIADNVSIGPWSKVGANVEIGEGTVIESHVIIQKNTRIGKNNKFHSFACIGDEPQILDTKDCDSWLEIGNNNTFREFCTVHRSADKEGGITKLGHHNLLMNYVHVAHDCDLGDHIIMANYAALAGHVIVEDHVVLGGAALVHQRCSLGAHVFIGGGSSVVKDILPFMMANGNHAGVHGLNKVGLKRRGFTNNTLRALDAAYKVIFRQGNTVAVAIELLQPMVDDCAEIQQLIDGLKASTRGVAR